MGASEDENEKGGPFELYLDAGSPPCRSVWLLCRLLDLSPTIHWLDLLKRQHMSKDFDAVNPQHSLPTLKQGSFVLWEARAILTYLADAYSAEGGAKLYPKDPQTRAQIDRLLYFDLLPLYYSISQWMFPQLLEGEAGSEYAEKGVLIALSYLEDSLGPGETFAAGGADLSLADLALVSSVAFLKVSSSALLGEFPRVVGWEGRVRAALGPAYEDTAEGTRRWANIAKAHQHGPTLVSPD